MMINNTYCYKTAFLSLVCTFMMHTWCVGYPYYEVWGGDTDYTGENEYWNYFYNIADQDYTLLGEANTTATFTGTYAFYVIFTRNTIHVDAVEGSDQTYAHSAWFGNTENGDNLYGAPNEEYAEIGTDAGTPGFAVVENPGEWDAVTVWISEEWDGDPNPYFYVDKEYNYIWGHHGPGNSNVVLTIGDPGDPVFSDTVYTDKWGDWSLGPLEYNIVAGDNIRLESGEMVREHEVLPLVIGPVDIEANTISGMGAPDSVVEISVFDQQVWRVAETDTNGVWLADFSIGEGDGWNRVFDLQPGHDGNVQQQGPDGNWTWIYWKASFPHFKIDPVANHVWGHDWTAGETVTVTRVESPDVTLGTTQVNEWGDWALDSPLDIQAFDLIRAESETIVREHVVTDLQVTEVNYTNNTIRGTAQTGTWVNVNIWYEDISREVEVNEHGEWLVDFNEPAGEQYWERAFDLEPGTRGAAAQLDEDGDETHIYWRLPDPVIRVNLLRNYVRGKGWTSASSVNIAIGDPENPYLTAMVQADRNGYWWFDPDEDYRIQPGDMLTVDDGTYVRTMTVAELSVTGADTDADTLSGTGPPNAYVLVRIGEVTLEAETNHDGEWTADLGAGGITLEEGTDGYVYFYDKDDNYTYIFWRYHTLDVEEIALIWVQWEEWYHFFVLEIQGKGILGARVQTPLDQWHELHPDDWELEWWEYGEHDESIEALDAKYPPGEYRVEITHYHGVSTAIVDFAETPEMPNAMPEIVSPSFGQSDAATPEADLEWADVAAPNFNIILAHYWDEFWDVDDERDHEVFIEIDPGDPFPTSVTMTGLESDRVYGCEVIFINDEIGDTTGEVEAEYLLLRAKVTDSFFSTNTDPHRFDPVERVNIGRYIIEENGDDPVYAFSFEIYFTDSVASLFHEIILRSPDGEAHHLYHTGISSVYDDEILFEIKADALDDLPADGWYVLVLRPDTEAAVCTPFWFGNADQVSPLPMPTQQPVIVHPLQDDLLASPVLITWETVNDLDVNKLAVIPADDKEPVILENLEQTTYGPIEKEAGEHLVGVIFAHGMDQLENDDGILFGGNKFRATLHTYTIGYALTYIAGPGGELHGPTHQVVRDGEDGEEIVADPEPGALLARWSDGIETAQRQDTHVTNNITVTAEFASAGGVPIDWYTKYGIAPEEGESWMDVDQNDEDSDGMKNWQEFIAGTNPTNANCVLRFRGVHITETGMHIEWQGGEEARQILERSLDLTNPDPWEPIFTNEPPTPIENEYTETQSEQQPIFYRITVERP